MDDFQIEWQMDSENWLVVGPKIVFSLYGDHESLTLVQESLSEYKVIVENPNFSAMIDSVLLPLSEEHSMLVSSVDLVSFNSNDYFLLSRRVCESASAYGASFHGWQALNGTKIVSGSYNAIPIQQSK
ncbi:hypothetical protein G7A66_01930 [Altererythrobacter sp. SALINAS58]|uniref:hypothetical protein n=1 Tax=Alteripontixanthobacter muriae TaxID=2705546 RepID=UPI0015763C85|nr:hypothetical protein [Alteripontixanthobacter muriae]NTZ41867.1 hypothetical protein [Alteripontixanthobacter muriae]